MLHQKRLENIVLTVALLPLISALSQQWEQCQGPLVH